MSATSQPPKLPYDGFPLRPHQNGIWYKSVWNRNSKKSEQFYFGSWADDPKGERAMKDPVTGWLARRDAIKAGIDNVRVHMVPGDLTLGELMARFLSFKRSKVTSGELSLTTLEGYLREISKFVQFQKPATSAGLLRPEHFSAFMRHLVEERKLGRHVRKRVVTYISTFLRYGAKNGWMTMPNTGVDWCTPSTDPDSMRVGCRKGVRYPSWSTDGTTPVPNMTLGTLPVARWGLSWRHFWERGATRRALRDGAITDRGFAGLWPRLA